MHRNSAVKIDGVGGKGFYLYIVKVGNFCQILMLCHLIVKSTLKHEYLVSDV